MYLNSNNYSSQIRIIMNISLINRNMPIEKVGRVQDGGRKLEKISEFKVQVIDKNTTLYLKRIQQQKRNVHLLNYTLS